MGSAAYPERAGRDPARGISDSRISARFHRLSGRCVPHRCLGVSKWTDQLHKQLRIIFSPSAAYPPTNYDN
jgi:hypothetical protein